MSDDTESEYDGVWARLIESSKEELRQIIHEEVAKALHPAPGIYDVSKYLRIECTDQDGKRWCGMLYAVEEA